MQEYKYEHRHFLRKEPPQLKLLPFEEENDPPPLKSRLSLLAIMGVVSVVAGGIAICYALL